MRFALIGANDLTPARIVSKNGKICAAPLWDGRQRQAPPEGAAFGGLSLFAQAQARDQRRVSFFVLRFDIVEQATTLIDHLQQPTP